MSYLLDTNALLWAVADPERLTGQTRSLIEARACSVSLVSYWEIAIKQSLGKLSLATNIAEKVDRAGIEVLGIEPAHIWRTRELPLVHRDPFDRLLVAQAAVEGLVLITSDRILHQYGVTVLSA